MRCAFYFALLVASALATAQPAAVYPRPNAACRPGTVDAVITLEQDRCYSWSEPVVTRTGDLFHLTQSVTPITPCTTPGSVNLRVSLGQLPVGAYRYSYEATPSGILSRHTGEFAVRTCESASLAVSPFAPLAMEPVHATFNLTDGCSFVSGVRPENGGFTITVRREPENPFNCDSIVQADVTIGAFPPGTYTVRLARPPSEGGEVYASTEFVVSPPGQTRLRNQLADYSGLWTSPEQQPSTGIDLINSYERISPGVGRNLLSGIWYFYDSTGRPIWYFIEANNTASAFGRQFQGSVYEYRATNPVAADFQRAVAGSRVGSIEIGFGPLDDAARMIVVLNGVEKQFRLQRFRWTRAAWPPFD